FVVYGVVSFMLLLLLCIFPYLSSSFFFFFNDPATTEIYTLSLHDALPICLRSNGGSAVVNRLARALALVLLAVAGLSAAGPAPSDRKSTRLNSSHVEISYAVFCLKKKIKKDLAHHDLHPQVDSVDILDVHS